MLVVDRLAAYLASNPNDYLTTADFIAKKMYLRSKEIPDTIYPPEGVDKYFAGILSEPPRLDPPISILRKRHDGAIQKIGESTRDVGAIQEGVRKHVCEKLMLPFLASQPMDATRFLLWRRAKASTDNGAYEDAFRASQEFLAAVVPGDARKYDIASLDRIAEALKNDDPNNPEALKQRAKAETAAEKTQVEGEALDEERTEAIAEQMPPILARLSRMWKKAQALTEPEKGIMMADIDEQLDRLQDKDAISKAIYNGRFKTDFLDASEQYINDINNETDTEERFRLLLLADRLAVYLKDKYETGRRDKEFRKLAAFMAAKHTLDSRIDIQQPLFADLSRRHLAAAATDLRSQRLDVSTPAA